MTTRGHVVPGSANADRRLRFVRHGSDRGLDTVTLIVDALAELDGAGVRNVVDRGERSSARPGGYDARRSTTSAGLNPASGVAAFVRREQEHARGR